MLAPSAGAALAEAVSPQSSGNTSELSAVHVQGQDYFNEICCYLSENGIPFVEIGSNSNCVTIDGHEGETVLLKLVLLHKGEKRPFSGDESYSIAIVNNHGYSPSVVPFGGRALAISPGSDTDARAGLFTKFFREFTGRDDLPPLTFSQSPDAKRAAPTVVPA